MGHDQDTWTTLPEVHSEYVYWQDFLKSESTSLTDANRLRTRDIILEHLRSVFFEANLSALPRVRGSAQTHLLLFHDNLRIVRERLVQISNVVMRVDAERGRQVLGRSPTVQMEGLEQDLAELANNLLNTLENALVHGWLTQEALDVGTLWRSEFAHTPEKRLWDDGAWIPEAQRIVEQYRTDSIE